MFSLGSCKFHMLPVVLLSCAAQVMTLLRVYVSGLQNSASTVAPANAGG